MKRSAAGRLVGYGRVCAASCVVVLLLAGGVWASWGTAHHIVLDEGREHGTMAVTGCGEDVCSGSFSPDARSVPRGGVTIERSVAVGEGDRFPVVVKPGTGEVVRTGVPGFLHAWVPLGGALVLAAVVIAGGLRLSRVAWGAGVAGGVLLGAVFVAL
ncbi:hypothetical protein [Streptomyces nitrosporeus]|uniref:Uncharacterized protein n=1 Tax=Streptomyces nitrosporeus TaxID=28894 RepID=A0A5J6FDD3_9ACTN|nr:hypothetical protein [Streptomyces nitrosporeus]QEU74046.1 hypothetical protein CP967_20425 [Streptomyces nitrosporeus]GGZ00238.1 hypothetical protein GCM10010327_33340 [Streptomyces nitrosporeus]